MKRLLNVVLIGCCVLMLGALIVPVAAQTGEGGTIIYGSFGSSNADTLDPIFCLDTTCSRLVGLLYPNLVGVEPYSASIQPAQPGGLAESWDISDDGLTYTFHLRDDMTWSDGTPVTAQDVQYTFDAIMNPANESDLSFIGSANGGTIDSMTAIDDNTLQVVFTAADCTALGSVALNPVPSHLLPADTSEMLNSDYNLNPSVTGGVFNFGSYTPEQISLIASSTYPASDTQLGFVSPGVFIQKLVTDQTVQMQQFLGGQISYVDGVPSSSVDDVRAAADAGDVQIYEYAGDAWDYLAMNFADPTNPQDAYDADGNPIDQGHHPIFGDLRVRQAIAMTLDIDAIIQGAVFGNGTRMPGAQIVSSWAHNPDLQPIPRDVEGATKLLDEAGWVDDDGDPSTPRICQGCMYAEEGSPLEFSLVTNEGNTRRTAIGQLVQDQLAEIGFQVDFSTIDFNVLIDDYMLSQTFDALILGWREGFPDDPDQEQLFASTSDTVDAGSNFTSYNDPEVDTLLRQALTVPGCAVEDRQPLYWQIEEKIQQDLPYVWLFSQNGMYAAQSNVDNWTPLPAQPIWNVDAWTVMSE